ncbi:hypothetical protein PSYTB_14325 [Pseudomonas amygdali pv. tabaci str. ATCC 11528]|nr:hypothetical protein PSYTB_14325 [Pseudomonas amygdali pv. tabaci str. ATCC 11528]
MCRDEAFSSENLEEGYSIDSSCDRNVSRYFTSDRCLSSAFKPESNYLKRFAPANWRGEPVERTRTRYAACIPGPDNQTGTHLHEPVKA